MPKRKRPTTRTTATLSPSVSPVPLPCVLCPALSCSLCAVLSSPQQRTMPPVPVFPTANECPETLKNVTRTRSEVSPTASGGELQVQRDQNALVSTGVQNFAKCTHREAPTASIHRHGDASVFGPNDADHLRVLHEDQDQRDLETRGPVVHGREPVPHSGAVRLSTHHPLSTGCRQPQARREPQRRGTRAQAPLPRPGRPAPREVRSGASVGRYGQGAV